MRFTKPSWVAHHDNHDPAKRVSIFSISVHPDGSRVATGGLDAKIRIWSTSPILSPKAEEKGPPKALCTLTMHTGPVLAVRWAASGKWLASGSDDTIVMIWDLDPNGGGRVWGSDDVNVEGWKALRRLTGHESDVVDCSWSPADRYLASVGLDSKVFIWCGYTLECLRRLDGHQGFVKGVCWDPVGEFLATQSDDKTVKIWRSMDWGLEATISKPFETSPGSTFFNRLSWSPDASYLATSNAMNNNGAVFVSAIVERDTWGSSISLVGHENTIQVASYNPRLFRRAKSMNGTDTTRNGTTIGIAPDGTPLRAQTNAFSPKKRGTLNDSPTKDSISNTSPSKSAMASGDNESSDEEEVISAEQLYSVVALGADDRSISIWRTTDQRPLLVAKEAFDRQILDLSWSFNGHHVWACSSDGSICVLDFEDRGPEEDTGEGWAGLAEPGTQRRRKGEMTGMISIEETRAYIKSFDFPWPPPLEANQRLVGQPQFGYQPGQYQAPHHSSTPYGNQHHSSSYSGGFETSPVQSYQQRPPLVSGSTSQPSFTGPAPPPINQAQKVTVTKSGKKRIQPTFLGGGATVSTSSSSHLTTAPNMMPAGHGPLSSATMGPGGGYSPHAQRPHSYSHGPGQGQPGGMDWTLSGSRPPGSGEAQILPPPPNAHSTPHRHRSGSTSHAGVVGRTSSMGSLTLPGLELPPLRTHVYAGASGEYIFEARNPEDHAAPTEVICAHGRAILWLDYVPARAFAVARSAFFNAVSLDDSSVIVYSPSGRRLMPTLSLDSPAPILGAAGRYLMAITTAGSLYIWNVLSRTAHLSPTSLASQVTPATGAITYTKVYDNGAALITLANGSSITWDKDLSAWVRVTETWWRQASGSSSSSSPTRRHGRHTDPGLSPIAASSGNPGGEPQTAFDRALNLGHLETKLHAAKLLGSPMDYRNALLVYSERLATEGLVERANELVRDLCGPLFWDPTSAEPVGSSKWEPKVVGISKRELLQEVLPIFARGRALAGMAQEWQILLARIESERDV